MEIIVIFSGIFAIFAHAFIIVELIVIRGSVGLGLVALVALWLVAFAIYTMIARAFAISRLSKKAINKLQVRASVVNGYSLFLVHKPYGFTDYRLWLLWRRKPGDINKHAEKIKARSIRVKERKNRPYMDVA